MTAVPGGHDPAHDDLHAAFVAEYADPGGGDISALTDGDEMVIAASE